MAIHNGEGKHMVMERFGFTVIFRSSKYLHKNMQQLHHHLFCFTRI
jgi:hypothetical protein